jgi:hypothetical protein
MPIQQSPDLQTDHAARQPLILVEDDFQQFSPQRWTIEAQHPDTQVSAAHGQLLIDSAEGVTVWLSQPLSGAYQIEFSRQVLVDGGRHDRLSDLNIFWAAHDPQNAQLFTRSGALAEYDNLDLYYVGMGGNDNSTTRFRRYDGHGERLLLGEYTDAAHLLEANRTYQVRIRVDGLGTGLWVDDELFFHARHHGVPRGGYFGFRTVTSRQAIGDFRVTRVPDA